MKLLWSISTSLMQLTVYRIYLGVENRIPEFTVKNYKISVTRTLSLLRPPLQMSTRHIYETKTRGTLYVLNCTLMVQMLNYLNHCETYVVTFIIMLHSCCMVNILN